MNGQTRLRSLSAVALLSLCPLLWAVTPARRFVEVDLRRHANSALMRAEDGNDLAALAAGLDKKRPVKQLKGIPFRLDGVLQVGPGPLAAVRSVPDIPIHRKAARLHFLHATQYRASQGDRVGAYVVRYRDGSQVEIPIRYGTDVADWWGYPDQVMPETLASKIAWVGKSAAASAYGNEQGIAIVVRLFQMTWRNPHPEREIRSLDMVTGDQAAGERAASPFLVAVTVETGDATGKSERSK